MSRRSLLKLGIGSAVAGGGLMLPSLGRATEVIPVKSTVRQGALPVMMGDSLIGVAPLGYGQFQGGQAFLKTVPDGSRGNMNRVNLVSAGPGYGVRADWTTTPIKMGDAETFEFWVYLESPSKWPNADPASGAQGYIYFADATFTNYFAASITLRRGWNFVRLGRDRFTAYGNPSWENTFPIMRTTINPCSSGPISAYIGEFRKGGKDRPLIAIMFDDGDESVRLNAQPLMEQYNIPYTISVISGWIGRSLGARTFSSMNQLAMHPTGTAFVNHTVSHLRSTLDQERTGIPLIQNEIQGCQQAMQGFPGFDPAYFVAPYGEWSTRYLQVLADCGVRNSRCLVYGSGPGYRRYTSSRLDNPLLMCSMVVSPINDAADLLNYVDIGIGSCQSMILVFHDIRPVVAASTDYALNEFQTFVEGLPSRSDNADFVTYPELCQRLAINGMV